MRILIIIITFIWVGMVFGISFVEAPLKFRAPNITLPLGLGIGKIVFGALNKIEIILAIGLPISIWFGNFPVRSNYFYGLVFLVLFIQSVWLIPILNERADMIIAGQEIPKSYHHITFIILEMVKITLLLVAGIRFLNLTE
ncbi:MAG: hypothetical protein AAGB24_15885 [Bacteroidota bacterium]